jgi:hypothetical protein
MKMELTEHHLCLLGANLEEQPIAKENLLGSTGVFGAVLEVAEESARFGKGGAAGAFRCPTFLSNLFSFTPESDVILSA